MKKLKELIQYSISSKWLILIVTVYMGIGLNLSFWRFIWQNVSVSGFSGVLFLVSLPFFLMAPIYLLLNLTVVPYLAKPLLIFFVTISSASNFFMYRYGVFIDREMIRNIFETSMREAIDLITWPGVLWIIITGVIPAIFIAAVKINYKSFRQELKERVIATLINILVLFAFAATSYKEYVAIGRNKREMRKLINTINYTYSTITYFSRKFRRVRKFKRLDEGAKLVPFNDPYKNIFVLVIGETARAKNFSLYGYEKKTNPLLEKQNVVSFLKTTSCGTSTAVSVPCMFSSMPRKKFDADEAKYTENLLDILQTAGYDVVWWENDDGCKSVCNRIESKNMVETKHAKFCFGSYCHDEVLLEGLEERIRKSERDVVIVLHTMGSHGPTYYNRYPDEFKKFQPSCDTADIQNCSREEITNTYDNTILYTDYIVASVIEILKKFKKAEAGMLYISDHGESLGENGIYLHGMPYAIAPREQIEVPMILWMSKTMRKYDYIDYECLKREAQTLEYSQDNMFHSLLGLLEVKTEVYDESLDMFARCRLKPLPFMTEKL